MTPTHVVSNGRRYGRPWSHNLSARHAAYAVGDGLYRTLCGRRWHRDAEAEIGGRIDRLADVEVDCGRCKAVLAGVEADPAARPGSTPRIYGADGVGRDVSAAELAKMIGREDLP